MNEEILKLWHQGFNPNQIAARLMIHKHTVEEVITNPGAPMATPSITITPRPKKKAAVARKKIK